MDVCEESTNRGVSKVTKDLEYRRLRTLIPQLAQKETVSKVSSSFKLSSLLILIWRLQILIVGAPKERQFTVIDNSLKDSKQINL